MKNLLFVGLVTVFILSCKSQQYTPYDYEGDQIVFGQGGGFTGGVNEYTLLSNGQLFAGTNKEGFVDELKPLKKNQSQQFFNTCVNFAFTDMILDEPGNQYYYLIIKNKQGEHKLQWGSDTVQPSKELLLLFSNLKKLTKDRILLKN